MVKSKIDVIHKIGLVGVNIVSILALYDKVFVHNIIGYM